MKSSFLTVLAFLSINSHALSLALCTGTAVEIRLCKLEQQIFLDAQTNQSKLNALDARLCIAQYRAAYSNYREFTCQPMWIAGIAPAGMVSANNTCLPLAKQGKKVQSGTYSYTCNAGKWVQSSLPIVPIISKPLARSSG